MKLKLLRFAIAALFIIGTTAGAWAQYNINADTTYRQNFDSLSASGTLGLAGWYIATDGSGGTVTSYLAGSGISTTAGFYAFANTTTPSDKSIGFVASNTYTGSAGTGKGYMGWRLKNNTGSAIASIQVKWTGEQWRRNDNASAQPLVLSYKTATTVTSVTGTGWTATTPTFSSPITGTGGGVSLDGNVAANRTVDLTATITVNIPIGSEIMLRWEDLNDSGNDHTLAIDDISFVVTLAAAPACGPATVTSSAPTGVSTSGATLNGNVTSIGSGSATSVTAKGFLYSLYSNLSAGTYTSNGTGTGAYTASLSSLAANTRYYYRAYARNDCPDTAVTATASVYTSPDAPVANAAGSVTTNSFAASWNNVTGSESETYQIQVSTSNLFGTTVVDQTSTSGSTISGLSSGTTYYYRVRATNTGGSGDWSNVVTFTTVDNSMLINAVNVNITENFNSYAGTLATVPVGWSSSNGTYNTTGNGSSATGGNWAYGTSGDYSLGALPTNGTGNITFTTNLRNTTGTTINTLVISYDFEQWRYAGNTETRIKVTTPFGTTYDDALTQVSSPSGTAGTVTAKTVTITGLSITNNSSFSISWLIANETNNDNGIAIDNFTVLANPTVLPVDTITTGTISLASNCAGTSVTVPFSAQGAFSTGNVYTAQLSNASGSFLSPVVIGTLTSTATSGNISATIPAGTATGTGYRIRVVSSNIALTGSDNGTNLTINALPATPANPTAAANPACASTTLNTMAPAAGTTNYWQGTTASGTSTSQSTATAYNVSSSNTYYVRAQDNTSLCWSSGSGSVSVVVNNTPGSAGTISRSPSGAVCSGSTYTLSVTNTPGTSYNWVLPSGWIQDGGGTSNSINVTAGTSIGNITVTPSNGCGAGSVSTLNIASVGTGASFSAQPADATVCSDATITFNTTATGYSSLRWQYRETGDVSWTDAYDGNYGISGATTPNLSLAYPQTNAWYDYEFRLKATGTGCGDSYSQTASTVGDPPVVTVPGTDTTLYYQNFGTTNNAPLPTGMSTYSSPSGSTLWGVASGSAASSGYAGASGAGAAMLDASSPDAGKRVYLELPTINTTNKNNIQVIWAGRRSGSYYGLQLLEYSVNGGAWQGMPYYYLTQYVDGNWRLENDGDMIQLPSAASNVSNLRIRISIPVHSTGNFRIDDITVKGSKMDVAAATVCSGASFNLPYSEVILGADKYSLTVSPAIPGFSPVVDATLPANQIPVTVPANTPAGIYQFKLSVKSTTTGCTSLAEQGYMVQVNKVTATASNTGAYTAGQTISLSSSATGATGTLGYSWSGPSLFTASIANPTRTNAQASYAGAYTVTITDAGTTCSATASTTVVVNASPTVYTWTGTISTEWNNIANWDVNAVPNDCTHNVVVPSNPPSGNYPAIDVIVSVGNIQLGNNSRITLDADLNVCGNWTGAPATPAILLGSSKVVFQGGAQQNISGKTQFNTLQANNNAGVQVQSGSAVQIFTALELKAGDFNAGNNLVTFRSISTTEVGIINNFSAGFAGTMSGSIKAERYYDSPAAHSFSQHFMGSPVNAPSVSQFGATGVPGMVQPLNCWIDSFAVGSPYGSMYEYVEANGTTCGVQVWNALTSGTTVNGKGYSVARTGAGTLTLNGAPNLNSTYSVSGLGNTGYSNSASYAQTPPLTTVTINSGWHLVANPYLADLNLTTHAANSAFDAQIQVWEATGPYAGTYRPRMTNSNAVLAPFQAFLVHKTAVGGSATYNLYASDRTLAAATFYRQANQSELKLVAQNLTTGLLDETYVAFNTDASTQFDVEYDANKVQGSNTRHTIYSVVNGTDYAINTLNNVEQTSTVPVSMRPGADASFKFTVEGINTFDATQYIYLEDKVTGQMIDLRQNPEYTFNMNTTEAFDRFVLHFTPAAQFAAADATCETQGTINVTQPGAASWNYTVTDANNTTISSGTLNQSSPVTVHAATGVYTVTLVDANNYTVARNIMISGNNAADATFNTSATTVEEGTDVVFTANQAGATYSWNLGNGATATGSGVTMAYTTPGVYSVELTVTTANGCSATSTVLVTVNAKVETGIKDVTDANLKLWSNGNKVYVDFSKAKLNNANVGIYNLIGQELSKENVTGTIYIKEVTQFEAGYVIVRVENNGNITTKKLLIANK